MASCHHCLTEHPPGTPSCPVTGEPMSAPGLIGKRVDRYELLGLLGAGGFGAVYRARHVHTEQVVALKVLKRQLNADASMLDRLLREAKAAASIGSLHIVRVLDAGVSSEGLAFLAMELLEGWDLKELAYRQGPLNATRVVLLVGQVLEALAAAHAKGIVHRDMKPANVFVLRVVGDNGVERDFVKLLDFGISKMHQEGPLGSLTLPGMAMGTPAYMAPEQFGSAKDVDGRSDLYSVAVMLFELLAGRPPFAADSYAELLIKVSTQSPPSLRELAPTLPPALVATVDRGLSRDVTARWQTADEFADALRSAVGLPGMKRHSPTTPSYQPGISATFAPRTPSPAGGVLAELDATATPRPTPLPHLVVPTPAPIQVVSVGPATPHSPQPHPSTPAPAHFVPASGPVQGQPSPHGRPPLHPQTPAHFGPVNGPVQGQPSSQNRPPLHPQTPAHFAPVRGQPSSQGPSPLHPPTPAPVGSANAPMQGQPSPQGHPLYPATPAPFAAQRPSLARPPGKSSGNSARWAIVIVLLAVGFLFMLILVGLGQQAQNY